MLEEPASRRISSLNSTYRRGRKRARVSVAPASTCDSYPSTSILISESLPSMPCSATRLSRDRSGTVILSAFIQEAVTDATALLPGGGRRRETVPSSAPSATLKVRIIFRSLDSQRALRHAEFRGTGSMAQTRPDAPTRAASCPVTTVSYTHLRAHE